MHTYIHMFNISKAYEIELFVIAEISEDINNYGLYKEI
jgi:hypothetical protein